MLATGLLTGLAFLSALVCCGVTFLAVSALKKADHNAHKLERDLRSLEVLRIDVDANALRLRRLAGTVYAPTGPRKRPVEAPPLDDDGEPQRDLNGLDPELAAELALQAAPPVAPGKRG